MGIRLDDNGDVLIDAVTYGPRGRGRQVCMRSRSEVSGMTVRTTSWVDMTVLGRTMTMTTVIEMTLPQLARIAGYKFATGFIAVVTTVLQRRISGNMAWITRRKKRLSEHDINKPPRQ